LNHFKEELYAYVGRIVKGETKTQRKSAQKKSGKIIYFPEYR